MTTFIKGAEVNRPTPTPLKSSVLDHATVVENPLHFGKRNNAGLWPSYNCLDTLVPTAICQDLVEDKEFDTAPWVPGFEFSVYGGVQCKNVGLDVVDQKREVERVFRLNEGRGVERALLENRFVALALDPANPMAAEWGAPVDLTPVVAGGVSLQVALALLEGYAATAYAGVPTIHMPRAAASLLGSDKIVWEDGKAYTRLGSKVAIGGGYDTTVPDQTMTMFATGEVYVEKSEMVNVSAYVVPGDGSTFESNTHITLAERMFRVGVDCFVASATGTVWA